MLHDTVCLQKDLLPPDLTFVQFWARMKHHSRNLRVLEYLHNQQNHMDHIKYECHVTDQKKLHQTKTIHGSMGSYIHTHKAPASVPGARV